MDSADEHVREVYAKYGLAAYYSQCLERSLAAILVFVHGPEPKQITRRELDRVLNQTYKLTMGQLLAKLGGASSIGGLDSALSAALKKRNWLIHSYFWDRAGHFMSETGRNFMLKELDEIRTILETVDDQLEEIYERRIKELGISPEIFDRQMQKLINEGAT